MTGWHTTWTQIKPGPCYEITTKPPCYKKVFVSTKLIKNVWGLEERRQLGVKIEAAFLPWRQTCKYFNPIQSSSCRAELDRSQSYNQTKRLRYLLSREPDKKMQKHKKTHRPTNTYTVYTNTHTRTHAHNLSWPGRDFGAGGQCCFAEITRYMGGTDPIRTLGMQAKVSQVTNTYATPRGAQTKLCSPHSISEQGLEMHAFHRNNVEMEKQWNWGD